MWIAEDRVLKEFGKLVPDTPPPLPEPPPLMATIEVAADRPQFNVLLLSDVHLLAPDFTPDSGKRSKRLAETRKTFSDRCRILVNALGNTGPLHLLVNCGDIIRGGNVASYVDGMGKKEPLAGYKVLYQDLSLKVLRWVQSTYHIPHVLSIPGNHDVYRSGKTLEELNGKDTPRYRPYYRSFASKLAVRPLTNDAYDRPSLFVAKIMEQGGAARPLAYVAVIGFDSNHEEYNFSYVENYGRVSKQQLDTVRDVILPKLGELAVDAPLYLIGVTHHHILPVSNTEIGGEVDRGRRVLEEKRTSLACLKQLKSPTGKAPASVTRFIPRLCAMNQIRAENNISVTTNAPKLIQFFQDNHFSLVIHGHMHQKELQSISRLSFRQTAAKQEVVILACPSFDGGTDGPRVPKFKGLIGLSFDLNAGEAQIVCTAEEQTPAATGKAEKAVQVTRPLISASRVSAAEMRLYRSLKSYLRECPERGDPVKKGEVEAFESYVDECMRRDGYVPVCNKPGKSLSFMKPLQHRRYFLLLLLKKDAGKFSMLLNRHKPLRLSSLADWDTLLVPAFTSVRELLNHFLDDIHRQYLEGAEYAVRAQEIKSRVDKLKTFLNAENLLGPDHWSKFIRVVSSPRSFVKFSPTDGMPTEYEYTLVTLEPFVSTQPTGQYAEFSDFINMMPRVLPANFIPGFIPGDHDFPINVLSSWGAGLRLNPDAGAAGKGGNREIYTKAVPHGAVWFPVAGPGERPAKPLWHDCPSIVARNADVMGWVDEVLSDAAQKRGDYPLEIRLGDLPPQGSTLIRKNELPFCRDAAARKIAPAGSDDYKLSTVEALEAVCFERNFDLNDKPSYSGRKFQRVVLQVSDPDSRGRQTIEIFAADRWHDDTELLKHKLGVLRPVQRYVLNAGMERAKRINDAVLDKMTDRWGFQRVALPGGKEFSIVPPVLEQLGPKDCEGDEPFAEFILCDGNHRVVQQVWNEGRRMAAVAVVGDPSEPFYARPFSKYEWEITAENRLPVPPDTASKYAVRRITQDMMNALPQPARDLLESKAEADRYRRYFRDLTTGFGYMGGQGGRPA